MTKLILKTQSQRVFHEYDSLSEAISAGKMLNFTTAMTLGVSDHQTWLEMLVTDEMPRFYIESETGLIVCMPEFN
jgi:hypothetical protein